MIEERDSRALPAVTEGVYWTCFPGVDFEQNVGGAWRPTDLDKHHGLLGEQTLPGSCGDGMAKAQGSDTNLFLFCFTAGNLPVLPD